MEKSITQPAQAPVANQATQADDVEALQRQRQAVEKRLDDANSKHATARLGETLERGQQSDRFQVIEHPVLPQRPLKTGRLKLVGIAFALAAMAGVGAVFGAEMLDRSISGGHELSGIVGSHLIISIPYIFSSRNFAGETQGVRGRRSMILLLGGHAAAVFWVD